VIVTFARWREDFEPQLPALRALMAPACGLWIAWPKRAVRVHTDVTVVREVALAGLSSVRGSLNATSRANGQRKQQP